MSEITNPEIKLINSEGQKSVFEISPLFPGYGITIGNAIRRILYSSLEGSAATAVKIEGVSHEFSTVKGIREDIIHIILNLKKVYVKLVNSEKAVLKLNAKGPKKILANDFEKNSNVEIINSDVEIANLEKGSELKLELTIEKGIGYLPVEKSQKNELAIGTIAIDANFSPIISASYKIENIRVGQITNYEKVVLEVETNGSVLAENAVKNAAEIMVGQFKCISGELNKKKVKEAKISKKSATQSIVGKMRIEEISLASRITNALLTAKIKTVGNLMKLSEEKMMAIDGLGKKAVTDINKKLKKLLA